MSQIVLTTLVLAVSVALASCGSNKQANTPTSPTNNGSVPSTPQPPVAVNLSVTPAVAGSTVMVSWQSSQVSLTPTFIVEAGRTPGASDIGVFDAGGQLTYGIRSVTGGRVYVRVRTQLGTGVSAPSAEVSTDVVSVRDLIEALFLRSGPLAVAGNSGCSGPRGDRRIGYLAGSQVTMFMSREMGSTQASALRDFVDQLGRYTSGRLVARLVETDVTPMPAQNEMTIDVGDPSALGCAANVTGCALQQWNGAGLFISSRVMVRAGAGSGVIAHELGHSILGLCHVDSSVAGPGLSVMTPTAVAPTFTDLDVVATRAVHEATDPGATRSQFVAAGLISGALPTLFRQPRTFSGETVFREIVED